MNTPLLVIACRIVGAEVTAAALEPPERRSRDQTRHADQVKLAPLVGRLWACLRAYGAPAEFADRRLRGVERGKRAGEALPRAKQAGMAPHQVANRFACHG